MSNRLNLTYNRYANLINCENFDEDMLLRTEELAAGLSYTEALEFWGLKESDLNAAELRYFNTAYKRGISKAKQLAAERLFAAMSGKNGGELALQYLRMFGDKFPVEDTQGGVSGGFSLKIIK